MKLIRMFQAELYKQKRGFIWWFILLIPLGTTGAMLLDMYIRYDYLYRKALQKGLNSWQMLLSENHSVLGWGIFMPVFIAVVCCIIHYTETSNKANKMLMSFPVTKLTVYVSKLAVTLIFLFLMIILNSLGLLLVGKIIGFPEAVSYSLYGEYVAYQCAAVLGVAALHHWLSSYSKNPIIPIIIGIFGMLLPEVFGRYPGLVKFIPYSYTVSSAPLNGVLNQNIVYYGIISCGVITLLGYLEFRRRDII